MELQGYRTYISIIIAVLPTVVGMFGFQLADGALDQIASLLGDLITIGGAIAAFYFRAKAEVPGFLVK